MEINLKDQESVSHEVLYEDELVKIKDRPMFLGAPLPPKRFIFAVSAVLLVLLVLIFRAFSMQVKDHDKYLALAERNRLRTSVLQPKRGVIRDRTGVILADNVPTFDISVIPVDLPQDEETRNNLLGKIARVYGIPISDIEADIKKSRSPDRKIIIARDVAYEQAVALLIGLGDSSGVFIEQGAKRRYPLSIDFQTFSHFLGYTGKITEEQLQEDKFSEYKRTDSLGKMGVEAWYEDTLRGRPGEKVVEVDSHGKEQRVIHEQDPVPGEDLYLTIDVGLQKETEQILKKHLEENEIQKGTLILMDPRDGSLLAVASWPAYDNNIFSGHVSSTVYDKYVQDPNNPFLARAWAGLFPSGSTIKPVYAVALLADNVITRQTTVFSSGGVWVGSRFFPDWQAGGHGTTDVRRAIAWSVNTFFYLTCGGGEGIRGLGAEKMSVWLEKFGFGSKTGLDLPGEAPGNVPSPQRREEKTGQKWYTGDTYNYAIGQGDLLVTPLQIALATGLVANGGQKITPHFNKNFFPAEQQSEIASDSAFEVVRLGMRDTVIYGSGRSLANMPFTVAGKTGTAQWRQDRKNHAWFTAFAPYEEPRVVVVVLLEEGEEGSRTAIPVAREALMAWNKYINTIN